ncbi:MAG: hypothetical protein M1812_003280 [Candelaria pacifica]|nr:MAG: hypothetical protein M1812_003280 [Candelaria pacifica]
MSKQSHMLPPKPRPIDRTRAPATSSNLPPSGSTRSNSGLPPMYKFGDSGSGDYYRPTDHARDNDRQSDFSFRPINDGAPRYPSSSHSSDLPRYANQNSPQQEHGSHNREMSRAERVKYPRNPNRRRPRGRGGYNFTPTHERPLLRSRRETTPEQMAGMTEAQGGQAKFMAADDVSDSVEEDMELESEDEDDKPKGSMTQKLIESGLNGSEVGENEEPPRKKQVRTGVDGRPAAESTGSKWSNPDPYTVLPPIDESLKKKKDVLKLIRKARVAVEKSELPKSAVAANEDFISFGFDDEVSDDDMSGNQGETIGQGVPGAPTGPGSSHFSHLQNLHGQALKSVPEAKLPPQPATALRPLKFQANADSTKIDVWPSPDTDAALGNRKRNHDDEIKGRAPQKFVARNPKMSANGEVLEEWLPIDRQTATPWYTIDHSNSDSMSYWLHKEIVDFYDYVRPREFEHVVRSDLLQRLRSLVQKTFPGSDLRCFGSFAAGIYLPNADMDLVVVSETYMQRGRKSICQHKNELHAFARTLERAKACLPGSVEVVAAAKVPLVKFMDKTTGLKVDLSFENDTGLTANHTFQSWKAEFPAMPIIVTLIKQLLMMRGLHEVVNGGLGGFSITCLVTSLLQNMPPVVKGGLKPEQNLGDIFMEFLNFYGNLFNTTTTGIQLNPPGYFEKRLSNLPYRKNNMHRLSILDPNMSTNDISGGTRNIMTVLDTFSRTFSTLRNRMADLLDTVTEGSADGSILRPVFSADYTPFTTQRERLRRLYEERSGGNHQSTSERKESQVPISGNGIKATVIEPSGDGGSASTKSNSGRLHAMANSWGPRRRKLFKRWHQEIPGIPPAVTLAEALMLGGYNNEDEMDAAIERKKTSKRPQQALTSSTKTQQLAATAWTQGPGSSLHDPIELD